MIDFQDVLAATPLSCPHSHVASGVSFRLSFKAGNDYSLCRPILKATTCLKFVSHFQLNSPQCPGDSLQGAAEMGKRVQEMRNGNSEGGGQSELIFLMSFDKRVAP